MKSRFKQISLKEGATREDVEKLPPEVMSIHLLETGPAISMREDFCKYFLKTDTETQTELVEDFVAALREMFARIMNDSKDPH